MSVSRPAVVRLQALAGAVLSCLCPTLAMLVGSSVAGPFGAAAGRRMGPVLAAFLEAHLARLLPSGWSPSEAAASWCLCGA